MYAISVAKDLAGAIKQFRRNVEWFNYVKRFGFLDRADHPDVFVHYFFVQGDGYKSLKQGDEEQFDISTGTTGKPQADNVRAEKKLALASQ